MLMILLDNFLSLDSCHIIPCFRLDQNPFESFNLVEDRLCIGVDSFGTILINLFQTVIDGEIYWIYFWTLPTD